MSFNYSDENITKKPDARGPGFFDETDNGENFNQLQQSDAEGTEKGTVLSIL